MTTEIDSLTGMPVVPEGYYWHVDVIESSMSFGSLYVGLRKRHGIFYHTVQSKRTNFVSYEFIDGKEQEVRLHADKFPETILWLAGLVLKACEKEIKNKQYWQSIEDAKNKYKGNYPPKKLENNE
jgi:hypothetical protein